MSAVVKRTVSILIKLTFAGDDYSRGQRVC